MNRYAVVDVVTGACFFICTTAAPIPLKEDWKPGTRIVQVDHDIGSTTHYFVGDEPIAFPAKTSKYQAWDWVNWKWVEGRSAEQLANTYKVERAAEYPSIGDQLDEIWKWILDPGKRPTEMLDKIAAVKAKYPKPA